MPSSSAKRRYSSVPLDIIPEDDVVGDGNTSYQSSGLLATAIENGSDAHPEPATSELVEGDDKIFKVPMPRTRPRPPDTPKVLKAGLEDDDDVGLGQFRKSVVADIGPWVKEVPGWSFAKEFLPPLDPAISLDDVIRTLREGPKPVLMNDGWTAFADLQLKPLRRKKGTHENTLYFPFEEIINTIIDKTPSTRKRRFQFEQRPTESPRYSTKEYTGMPDGYGVLVPSDGILLPEERYWHQIVFTAEYKKTSLNTRDRNDVCPSPISSFSCRYS